LFTTTWYTVSQWWVTNAVGFAEISFFFIHHHSPQNEIAPLLCFSRLLRCFAVLPLWGLQSCIFCF
jgi:hypothetical protein